MQKRILAFGLVVILLLLTSTSVLAEDGGLAPCPGDSVTGTVVAVDSSTGTVTIDLGEGALCTVTLSDGNYSHPIVSLLGNYFDDVNPAEIEAALMSLQGCALEDLTMMTWQWVSCDTPDSVPVTIHGENPDGSFSATLDASGESIILFVDDPEQAAQLSSNISELLVTWQLGELGAVLEAGDRIAAFHEEGIGFGVIVKLFAIAEESLAACQNLEGNDTMECGVTVDELVELWNQDIGLGQLYKLYGKPDLLGVGHVKKQLREDKGKPPWAAPPDLDDGDMPAEEGSPGNGNNGKKDNPPGNPNKPDKPGKGKNKNK
ncbi:MAG: hypothetical protein R3335_05885 [Anaerolineales bacterium]|nr:hypothetical protein [Anaerolineales bacterium]